MTLDDWLSAGYKRFEMNNSPINKSADFGMQKLFSDDTGKRYYITVYVYDRSRYPGYPWGKDDEPQYGFMPTTHYTVGKDDEYNYPFFNLEMNGTFTIAEAEAWFEKAWEMFGKPYYSEWDK